MFSVIIPVYNVASCLKACLDSVLAAAKTLSVKCKVKSEGCSSVEIICIDDGSTDDSGRILDTFSLQPSTFDLVVLHQPNAGVAAARNRGLDAATGEWLLFVDSDDVVRESLFVDLVEAHARHPNAEIFGFGQIVVPHDATRPEWPDAESGEPAARVYACEGSVPDCFARMSAYRIACRADRFGGLRFPPYAHGEDLVYIARVAARCRSMVYLERREYGYRNRPGSCVHKELTAAGIREAVAFHSEVFRTLAASGKSLGSDLWQMRLEQWLLRLPVIIAEHGLDPAWRAAWAEWRQSMSAALDMPFVSGVCRVAARFAAACPFRPLVALASRLGQRILRRRRTGQAV